MLYTAFIVLRGVCRLSGGLWVVSGRRRGVASVDVCVTSYGRPVILLQALIVPPVNSLPVGSVPLSGI